MTAETLPTFRRTASSAGTVSVDSIIADTEAQLAELLAVDLASLSTAASIKHRLSIRGMRKQLEYLQQLKARQ